MAIEPAAPHEGAQPTNLASPLRNVTAAKEAHPRIVFFDGVCSFCDGAMQWLRKRDPEGRLHFASLQGETAAEFRRAFPETFPDSVESMAYVDQSGVEPRIETRADAVLRLCEEIGGGWALLRHLRVIPRALLDLAYRAFAANRYRLFGYRDACAIPTPEERERLLP